MADTINDVIEPLIYDEAIELIDQHLGDDDEVYLVSMAPEEIVEPFAELLGITGFISSKANIDAEGKYTGEMEFFAQGENKAVAIRALAAERGIDLAESLRLLRLRDRRADAGVRRPPLRRQPRPRAGQGRRRARVAHAQLHPQGARATTGHARTRPSW